MAVRGRLDGHIERIQSPARVSVDNLKTTLQPCGQLLASAQAQLRSPVLPMLSHQLRRAAQIPLRVCDVDVTEVGGQDRQEAFWISVRSVPRYQRVGGESVSHVMQTWSVIVGNAAQTDLPGQRIESSMNLSAVQTIAPAGNEQIGGDRASRPMTVASRDVVGKYFASRCVQRHESRLTRLRASPRRMPETLSSPNRQW